MQPHMESRPKADVYTTSDIRPGDYFYLCSDGMLEQPEMENGTSLKNIFSKDGGSPAEKVKILRKVTEDNKDNHSAFVVYISEVMDAGRIAAEPEIRANDKGVQAPERLEMEQGAGVLELSEKVKERNKSVIIFCIAVLAAALGALLWKLL